MQFLKRLLGLPVEPPEAAFWRWFVQNARRLQKLFEEIEAAGLQRSRGDLFDELSEHLKRVRNGLVFEFGPEKDGRRVFMVSGDGIRDHFPYIRRLVEAAPEIPGWRVVAFKQPVGTDITLEMDGRKLGADDLWFSAVHDPGQLARGKGPVGLRLFIRDLPPDERGPLQAAAYVLLDAALGEYAVTTGIAWIEWAPLPLDPVAERLLPFRQLPEVVQSILDRKDAPGPNV